MADDDLDDDIDTDEDDFDDEDGGGGGKKSKKKLLLLIGVPLILLIGGAAGAYFTGLLDPLIGGEEEVVEGEGEAGAAEQADTPVVCEGEDCPQLTFVPLDEILVNLNTTGRRQQFLKINVQLELKLGADPLAVEAVKARIVDQFQIFLRELRVEDIKGSAGMYRLREELLARVHASVGPDLVNDVLFNEILVQ